MLFVKRKKYIVEVGGLYMKYFDNHFLFSETYIKEYIKKMDKNNNNEVLKNAFTQVKQWNYEYSKGDYNEDPWEDYIDAVLDILGFKKHRENKIVTLYTNSIKETEKPVAICYSIDKEDDISSVLKGKYHAYNAIKVAQDYGLEWVMLTNGYRWRIYNTKNVSPYENYLEIDIETSINSYQEPNEAFKLFILFFNSTTYYKEKEELVIEKIKEESDKKAESIEEFLRSKAEGILTELCYGLKDDMNKVSFNEIDRKNIYGDAIILLYRLLFFGYAESRKLLPVVENDIEYNDSFDKLCNDARNCLNNGELYLIHDGYEYWERLDNHLRIYVDKTYNGGLFHNIDKPILREHRIKNKYLIKCLAELSYAKDRNGQYHEKIEYKDLSVRNLGSIYEGMLEYHLFIAEERMVQRKSKGKVKYILASETKLKNTDLNNIIEPGGIYLSQDALERKESGSYYTPEDVVEYIVTNTVGKKIDELKNELYINLEDMYEQLTYEPTEQGKRIIKNSIDDTVKIFIEEKILSLAIIDSAMGSGHFLVNAAYKVANEIVDIVSNHDWNSDVELPADIAYWKRKVVENCIYGIDLNGLAVALARLSLWLISASNDKALSFIDHHLKKGNSIIGTDKTKVELVNKKDDFSLFDVSYERIMESILRNYELMKEIGSATKEDVERQKEIYEEIECELEMVKRKYDYYLASQYFGGIPDEFTYFEVMNAQDLSVFEDAKKRELLEFATKKNFFHWELEFPNVINNGGFDVAIGNPPYVEADHSRFVEIVKTRECHNLYAFMIENTLKYLKSKAHLGVILPSASLSTPRMKSLQELIIKSSDSVAFSTFDDRPSKIFRRIDSLRVAIILADISKTSHNSVVLSTKYNRWYSSERSELFNNLKYTRVRNYNYIDGYIPKVGSESESSILRKIFNNNNKIKSFVGENDINNNVYYGYGVRYWIKAMNKSPAEIDEVGRKSTGDKELSINPEYSKKILTAILNSSTFFTYFTSFSDCRNLTKNTIQSFPFDYNTLKDIHAERLIDLCDELMDDYIENSSVKTANYATTGTITYREYYPKKSKKIIDKIDCVLADYYGFSDDELKYILDFEYRFRMGKEATND